MTTTAQHVPTRTSFDNPKNSKCKSQLMASIERARNATVRPSPSFCCREKRLLLLQILFFFTMVDIAAALLSAGSVPGEPRGVQEIRPALLGGFIAVKSLRSNHRKNICGPHNTPNSKLSSQRTKPAFLVPSQVLKAHPESSDLSTDVAAPIVSTNDPRRTRRRQRRKTTASSTNSTSTTRLPKTGNLPDIYWRSIPMEHLRHHPGFESLPVPESISKLDSLEDIRLFRQASWQWDAVHEGRCTTSQAVAALGFLEPETGKFLGIPRSWQRGGLGPYHRLRKPALRTLEELNQVLCSGFSHHSEDSVDSTIDKNAAIWSTSSRSVASNGFPYAASYKLQTTGEEIKQRRELSEKLAKSPTFDFSIRMMWGNIQEATALLTALNYFWKEDNGIILKEVGMCGGGLQTNQTDSQSSLLVGATPDGILCYPNGTIEALEVKNHCPFYSPPNSKVVRGKRRGKRFVIRHFDFNDASIPAQYVPQMMMEMLCVGENCRSAVMVRQTATSGALVLRMRRDDEWIEEMLYWLNRFQSDFVERNEPPPTNFFLQGSTTDRERYLRFLERTKEIQAKVEIVANIPHGEIQRATTQRPGFSNLFLD